MTGGIGGPLEAEPLGATNLFRVLAESSLAGFCLIQEGCFQYANTAIARIFGYQVEELLTRIRPLDLVHSADREAVAESVLRRLDGEETEVRRQFTGLRKDGSSFPVEVLGRRVEYAGKVSLMATFIEGGDVHRALDTLDELRAVEARLGLLMDHATEAFFVINFEGFVRGVNRQACTSLGYSREELLRMHVRDFDADVDEAALEHIRRRFAAGEALTFETRHRRKDGSIFPVEVRSGPFFQGGLAFIRDITERKRAENELRASEARFRTFVDYAADAFFLHDDDLTIVDVNRQACLSLGYSREELIGMRPTSFDVALDEAIIQSLAQRVAEGETVTFETVHRRKDGTTFPVEARAGRFEQGGKFQRLTLARDISERKQAQDKLREAEERFRVLAESSLTGVYLVRDGVFGYVNPALASMFGYGVDELVDRLGPIDLTYPLDRHLAAENIRRRVDRVVEEVRYEVRGVRKDGSVFPIEVHGRGIEIAGKIGIMGTVLDNTERQRAVDELRASEARSLEMQRMAHVGWWERDFSTNQVSLSDEVRRIFGVEPVALPGQHERWLGLIHPEDRERAAEASAAAMRGEGRYDVEYRIVRPDGSLRVVHSQGDVIRDGGGSPKSQFGVLQDISALREAERELRSSEARFRTFVDHAMDAFFLHDDDLTILDVNRQACLSLGYSREELVGMHPRDFDAGLLDEASIERMRRLIGSGEVTTFETRHRRKDGTVFPVEIRAAKFKQGGQRRHLTLVRDISERKRAEEALQQRDAKIRRLVDANIIGIFVEEYDGRIVEANDAFLHMLGLGREDLASGINWRQLTPPEWRARGEEATSALDESGAASPYEKEFFRKGGDRAPVLIGLARIDDGSKRNIAFVLDLAQRKRAEEALKESEDRFRALVQFSFDVYWESDAEHRFTRQEFANGLVDSPEPGSEIGKRRWEVPYLEPDEDTWRRHRETLDAHLPFRDFELVRPAPDGGKRYVSVSGLPVFDQVGHFLGYRGVGRHITRQKLAQEALREMQRQLAHSNRLETMGQLTASIAHEVNHPIATAVTNARVALRFLHRDPPDLNEVGEALDCIVRDGGRAAAVVQRIRDLSKKASSRDGHVEINAAAREVIEFTRSEATKSGVSVRSELAEGLPLVRGDRVELQQVMLNLILNAVEAMSGMDGGEQELLITTGKNESGDILVSVRDSGPGLPPEVQKNLFKAFQTTKPNGLGLGLSICRSIVERHGGCLWASANTPRGAVFQFTVLADRGDGTFELRSPRAHRDSSERK